MHDPLTGLADWHVFADRAAGALARATRAAWSTALLAIDLDQFHQINERYGYPAGDGVLVEVAQRLDAAFRPYDIVTRPGEMVFRFGGDEFMVLCENVPDSVAARALSDRVAVLLGPPVELDVGMVPVSARVGVALVPPGEANVEQFAARAESALVRAKQGPGPEAVIVQGMGGADADLDDVGRDLRRGLEAGELRLHYQPTVALDRDRIVGVEALLRWQHPERGMVAPLDFIGLAEETGLIVPIGAWVIEEACRQATRWRAMFPDRPPLVVSVNVSARQFGPGLVDVVDQALAAAGTDPASLCLEVTESVLMEDVEGAVAILGELADIGVALSIDDFGTGYSSLAYLRRFPLDELKIDKCFVDGLGTNDNDTTIVAAVVAMAHALGLRVVGEGVESAEQLDRLRTLGCEQVQGYYFARPGTIEAVDALLRAEAKASWDGVAPSAHEPGVTASAYRPERILVVDDAEDVRQLTRLSLTAVGFEVHEAADGASALIEAARSTPDCILLDLVLPDTSGLEVCRALRDAPATSECTIVVITSNDSAADKVEAFSSGADDYIIKPFSPRDLASRVHAAMRRRAEAAGRPHEQPEDPSGAIA